MRVLFQGDSITDAGRDRSDPFHLGAGYAKLAAALIREAYPGYGFEFINLGVSGYRTEHLVGRLQEDFIDIRPDVLSVMIGINDTWHAYGAEKITHSEEYYEDNYRRVLSEVTRQTNAKIIILEQFLLPVPGMGHMRVDMDPKIQITRKLAREFADVFVPLDGLFAAASVGQPPETFAADGVHPTEAGAQLIARHYFNAFCQIIKK